MDVCSTSPMTQTSTPATPKTTRVRPGMYRLTGLATSDGTPVIVTVDQLGEDYEGSTGLWRYEAETETGGRVIGYGDAEFETTLREAKAAAAAIIPRMVWSDAYGWVAP